MVKRAMRRFRRKMAPRRRRGIRKNRIMKVSKYSPVKVSAIGGFPKEYYCHLRISSPGSFVVSSADASVIYAGVPLNYPGASAAICSDIQGWDQLTSMYDEYVVTASAVNFMLYNNDATGNNMPLKCVLLPIDKDTNSIQAGNLNQTAFLSLSEAPNARTKYLNVPNQSNSLMTRFKNYISVRKLSGHKPTAENSDLSAYTGSTNSINAYSKPIDQYLWFLAIGSIDGTTGVEPSKVLATVVIDYYIKFYSYIGIQNT